MRISPLHAQRYRDYYAAHPAIMVPSRWIDRVREIADRVEAKTILDYGSGPSRGISRFLARTVRDYDPGVEGLDIPPKPVDLVCCIHTLEHVEPDCLDAVVDHLQWLARKAVFVVVSCEPSTSKVLPDGTPWHTLVRDATWWKNYLRGFKEQPPMKERPGAEYAALLTIA